MTDFAEEAWQVQQELFSIYRTLMGTGFEKSLELLSEDLGLNTLKFKTGTECGSWTVPQEWSVNSAWIKDPDGNVLIDFSDSSFHLWQYSTSFHGTMGHNELMNCMSVGKNNAIPLIVTYYKKRFGFSISELQMDLFNHKEYEVFVDTDFKDGNLTIGELLIPGERNDEILIDAVLSCSHLANNLTGVSAAYYLAKYLLSAKRNYSYRILFTPETLGPIANHHCNKGWADNVIGGVNLMNLGDGKNLHYKKSRKGDSIVDQAMQYALVKKYGKADIKDYNVMTGTCGNEKAYNSLGIELNVGALRRSVLCSYPEYDTSLDTMEFISRKQFEESLQLLTEAIEIIELNEYWKHEFEGEPFLTGYGLFPKIASDEDRIPYDYLMGFTNGNHSVVDLANMAGIDVLKFREPIRLMAEKGLIKKAV